MPQARGRQSVVLHCLSVSVLCRGDFISLLAPLLQQSSMDGESTCTAVWVLLGVVGLCGGETAVLNGRRGEEREGRREGER